MKSLQHILIFYCVSLGITNLLESYAVMSLSCQVNHKNMCGAPGDPPAINPKRENTVPQN